MIRAGAQAVEGWAMQYGFTVLFCSGNLAFREMYENLRDDPTARIILVDRTRDKAKRPLFYPDLEARCKPQARLTINLRDFLTEKTGDQSWILVEALPNAAAPVPDVEDGEAGAGVERLRELGLQQSLQFLLLDQSVAHVPSRTWSASPPGPKWYG
jgi:hypothetical protein